MMNQLLGYLRRKPVSNGSAAAAGVELSTVRTARASTELKALPHKTAPGTKPGDPSNNANGHHEYKEHPLEPNSSQLAAHGSPHAATDSNSSSNTLLPQLAGLPWLSQSSSRVRLVLGTACEVAAAASSPQQQHQHLLALLQLVAGAGSKQAACLCLKDEHLLRYVTSCTAPGVWGGSCEGYSCLLVRTGAGPGH